jgi:hypothetical protein
VTCFNFIPGLSPASPRIPYAHIYIKYRRSKCHKQSQTRKANQKQGLSLLKWAVKQIEVIAAICSGNVVKIIKPPPCHADPLSEILQRKERKVDYVVIEDPTQAASSYLATWVPMALEAD